MEEKENRIPFGVGESGYPSRACPVGWLHKDMREILRQAQDDGRGRATASRAVGSCTAYAGIARRRQSRSPYNTSGSRAACATGERRLLLRGQSREGFEIFLGGFVDDVIGEDGAGRGLVPRE